MKLSEAIALGRHLVPSIERGDLEKCALGMALHAIGCHPHHTHGYALVRDAWPWVNKEVKPGMDYLEMIYSRFDNEVMLWKTLTLDDLIDWVRTIEPSEPAPTDTQPHTVITQHEAEALAELADTPSTVSVRIAS